MDHQETGKKQGHLKIFFGYADGPGKTYAMLEAGQKAKACGTDVVIGYVNPLFSGQKPELLERMEFLPHVPEREFDLDAALERNPELLLLEHLAHVNEEGCRHHKRYQDVEELLRAGIDVCTTVNVQDIESLKDVAASITGRDDEERIPDSVFDRADQVEFVDRELEELMALRKIALNRCAGRGSIQTAGDREAHSPDEHILVCLSSAPSNMKIIRTAARMAQAFRGDFTALFVETPDHAAMSEENRKRLQANMRLAQQLGARIETVYGEDIPYQIAEYARLSGVTKIVIGRSTVTHHHFPGKQILTEKLILYAPNLDIHIIPDQVAAERYEERKQNRDAFVLRDAAWCVIALSIATCLGLLFQQFGFTEVNIVTLYILSVQVIAVVTSSRIYSLVSSLAGVFVFNFFFTSPKYTLLAYDQGYPVTFLVMFLASLITGTLASRLKNHAKQSAMTAYRTKVLFDTNQLLGRAKGSGEIIQTTANQLVKLLGRTVVMYQPEQESMAGPTVFSVSGEEEERTYRTEAEREVADWVWKNNKHAGATTDTLSKARCFYLAIRINEHVYGVAGIDVSERSLDAFENSILLSVLGECALALENDQNAREKEEAAVLAQNEQLRANLLRSISHDLRTPLTSIYGNAGSLLLNEENFDKETRKRLYSDIYDDAMWLISLVENLLSVTRIEGGGMNLRMTTELMDEVVEEALHHVNRRAKKQEITVQYEDDMLLARMDAKLVVQVVVNLLDNAVKYTPEGSRIEIYGRKRDGFIEVTVSDYGPGISEQDKPHVFDMFYSGANRVADSRRSLGLGLALCRTIIKAHGGEIQIKDRDPHGTEVLFTLPAEEVTVHE